MPQYKVEIAKKAVAAPHANGIDAMHINAKNATEAKAIAKGFLPLHNEGMAALWNASVVTDASTVADLTGWKFKVAESTVLPNGVTYTGVAGDTLDTVGAALAALLVTAGLATASYAAHLLTVETSAANHGANTITVTVTPPSGLFPIGYTWAQADAIGTITHQGIAASALTVALNMVSFVPAAVIAAYKQA